MSSTALSPVCRLRQGAQLRCALLLGSCGMEFKDQPTDLTLSRVSRRLLENVGVASAALKVQLERLPGTREELGFATQDQEPVRAAGLGAGVALVHHVSALTDPSWEELVEELESRLP